MRKFLPIVFLLTLLIVGANSVKAQSFADNIVSQWTFNDGTAKDLKTGVTGTVIGDNVTYVAGKYGQAVDFSAYATGDLAGIVVKDDGSNLNAINFTTESFTVAIWTTIDPTLSNQMLIVKGTNSASELDFDGNAVNGANGNRFVIETKEGNMRFAIDDDINKSQLGVDVASLADGYPTGWVQFVGVRDRENTMLRLYLNGVEVGSMADATGDLNIAGQDFVIGNFVTGANVAMGQVDEVYVINKALSAEEIVELMSLSTKAKDIALNDQLKAIPVEGGIKLPSNSNASVYSISGKLIQSNVNADFISCAKGMYIVRVGNSASKVMVTK